MHYSNAYIVINLNLVYLEINALTQLLKHSVRQYALILIKMLLFYNRC